jgi:hypothetical protein
MLAPAIPVVLSPSGWSKRTIKEFTHEPEKFRPGFLRKQNQGNVDKNFFYVKTTFSLTTYLNKGTDPPHSEAQ